MSIKDMVNGYESIGRELNNFLYKGKVKNNIKAEHTKEELEQKLEEIRLDIWECYKNAIDELEWK